MRQVKVSYRKKPRTHARAAAVAPMETGALNPNAFRSSMQKMRQIFASKGIKSKADAYQLINQGFAEKRFNEADVVALQHAAAMVFDDNSFEIAKNLYNAKEKGLALIAAKRQAQAGAPKTQAPQVSKEAVRARNRAEYAQPSAEEMVPEEAAPEATEQPQQPMPEGA